MSQKLFNKDFTLVVIGQIISLFGNAIVRFALPLYLLKETGSAYLFGLVSAVSFIPMIVLVPVGGIIADRLNKQKIMVVLDFFTSALLLFVFVLIGKVDLVTLIMLSMMTLFAIQGAYTPSVQSSIPILQSQEHILPANAIINQVTSLANLVGPILGGVLFGIWGILPIILISSASFFISAMLELFIVIPHKKQKRQSSILRTVQTDITTSYHFIKHEQPIILQSIAIIFVFNLLLGSLLMISIPVLVTQTLSLSGPHLGITQGLMAAGGLIGGIIIGVYASKWKLTRIPGLLSLCILVLIPIGIVLQLNASPFISYLVITFASFAIMILASMISILILSFIQYQTPIELTGKVLALTVALATASQPIGSFIYGSLLQIFSHDPQFVIFIACFISLIFSYIAHRWMNSYRKVLD